ncbi:MAG TPA: hypothetical protein VG817_09270 [Gemmatimonadales bacterium]|nr:hypothetical protein [Gemmatimonadales bacterium]
MRRTWFILLFSVGAAVAFAQPLLAQDRIPKVRYKGGHEGWGEEEIRGVLLIGDSTITFRDEDKKRTLVIPILKITDIGNQTQRKEASVGSKLLFGSLARSRQEEFLAIAYELPDNAEAVVFRFEPNTSAAVLAKIKFRMKKLGMTPPAGADAAPVTAPAN